MDLSNDLISKFVKITNDDKNKNSESTVYGTVVEYNGGMYVRIDGSDLLTPVETTADFKPNERVTVMIKNHSATVTGNITSPATNEGAVTEKVTEAVEEVEGKVITEVEILIADRVSTKQLDAEVARIDELIAGKASVEDLTATNAEITNLKADKASIKDLTATNAEITNLKAKDAEIENLVAGKATVEDLTATNAEITNLKAKDAEIENLVADKARIEDLTATNARIDSLQANKADITYLDANFATIDELEAAHADIEILDAEVANINTLVNGNLTSDNILSLNITSQNTTMENAFVKDAMIDTVTANKIMSGTIDTNNVTIQSTDGSMLLQGTLLQMKDDNGKVRIQIGKDTGGNFTFILYDESGTGVLIDEEGIKSSDAIADGLIVDAKVADNANIAGSKLDIASVITEVNNDNSTTIKSNKIYLDEQGQSLEVAFNSLKTQVETIQDVTIDGDLTAVIEQVQSNTTQIAANKEGISTLVSENTSRKEEIQNLDGEIESVNSTLSSKYSSLEQDVSGFKTTVADTYTTKSEFNGLQIGGVNLVLWSECIELDSSDYGNNDNSIIENNTVKITPTTDGNVYNHAVYTSETRLQGETYTLSFDILSPDDIGFYWYPSESYSIDDKIKASSKWQTVSFTYTQSGETTANPVLFGFHRLIAGHVYYYRRLKLEKGNKPTAWSPAPEDVQGQIDATNNNLAVNYSTTSAMNSAIQQKANEITSTVSQTYTTKSETTAVQNQITTSRNLLMGSRDYNLDKWRSEGANILDEWYNDTRIYTTTVAWASMDYWVSDLIDRGVIELFTPYTFSCYVMSTGSDYTPNIHFFGEGLPNFNSALCGTATTSWQRISITIEWSSFDNRSYPIRFEATTDSPNSSSSYLKWACFQLERGRVATGWGPAPEDAQYGINEVNNNLANNYSTTSVMNSAIQQKANEITSTVSETYTTKSEFNNLQIGGTNLIQNGNFKGAIAGSTSMPDPWTFWSDEINIYWSNGLPGYNHDGCVYIGCNLTDGRQAGIFSNDIHVSKVEKGANYMASFIFAIETNVKGATAQLEYLNDARDQILHTQILTTARVSNNMINGLHEHQYHIPFTMWTGDFSYIRIVFNHGGTNVVSSSYLMVVGNVQIEKGNKATDWSPAPEDIQGQIDATNANLQNNYSTTSAMNSAINQKANEITSSVSQTYATKQSVTDVSNNLTNNYSTTSAMNSVIDQKANEITSSVSETYTTKSEFNALNIGSTNLVAGTKDFSISSGWAYHTYYMTKTNEAGIDSRFTGMSVSFSPSTASDDYADLVKNNSVWVEPDTEYTLSFWAKGSGKFYTYLYGLSGGTVASHYNSSGYSGKQYDGSSIHTLSSNDTFKRYWVVYKTKSTVQGNANLIAARVAKNLNTDVNMVIYGVKFEKGNKPTDWSPAPEDVDASISSVDSKIETTNNKVATIETNLNGITQRVSSTESTTSTLTTKVNTAQSTADSAVNSFNNLAIGGTNLYPNSNFITRPTYSEISKSDIVEWASSVDSGGTVAKYGGNLLRVYMNAAGDNYFTLSPQVTLEPNTTYTLSYDYVSAGAISSNSSYIYLWGTFGDASTRTVISAGDGQHTAKVRKRYKLTFTTGDRLIMQMRFGFANTSAAWLAVEGIKLEKGNKATEWSPSVNDVESRIDTAQSTADTANTQATTNKNNISSLTTTVSNTNNKVSSLETNLTNITSRVSATETNLTIATTKLDNLKIGGTNLLRDTKTLANWGYVGYSLQTGHYDGTMSAVYINYKTSSGIDYRDFTRGSAVWVEPSTEYTLSFWAKGTGKFYSYLYGASGGTIASGYNSSGNTSTSNDGAIVTSLTSATQWRRYWVTWKTNSSVKQKVSIIPCRVYQVLGDCEVLICGVKLEVGNKATEWSPSPEDIETTVSNLTTRVSTAESKLDKDSLTTIIGSYYTTSSDVDGIVTSKKYATTSEVQQTKNELTATFTESGGYNLIKNSTGYGGTSCWIPSAGQVSYASHASTNRTGNSRFMYLSNTSLTTGEIYVYSSRFPLKGGKKYTLSGWFYMNPNVNSYDVFVLTSNSLDADNTSTGYDYVHHGGAKNNTGWQFLSFTFTTHSDVKSGEIRIDNNGYNKNGTTINCNVHWSSLMLNEGSIALPWSPHPSEVYSGITQVDKDGIKVYHNNANSYTHMAPDGFFVNNNGTDVVQVTASGLYVQGNITSGSTIQGARITGSTFNSSNDVFQVLEDGTVETSFLAVNGAVSTDKLNVNDIENASYPKVLSEATTVYISPNGGVNAEEFYDGAYFTSLSNMLAVAPRNLNGYTLTIRMAGDLYENAALTWFHSGQVNFEMQGYTLYGYFYGYGASMCYRLYGNTNANNNGTWGHIKPNVGRSLGSYYYAVQFQYCQFAVNYIAVYPSSSSGSSSGGISAHRGATGIIFNAKACGDMRYLVRAEYAGRVHVNSTQGACNNATFCASNGGIITLNSSNKQAGRSTSGNPYWVGTGGLILCDQVLGMEKITFNNTAQSGSSSSSGSATRKVTETVKATSADTYRSTVYNNWKGDGTVRQGDYGYGDCQGCWFFGNNLYNTMNAGTVTKVVIRIQRQSGGVNALQTLTVKSHNHTSRPSGAPTYTNTIGTCSCAVGSHIDLVITDQTTINKLKNCKGLGLSIGSASSPYAVCSGACSVIITYTTNS